MWAREGIVTVSKGLSEKEGNKKEINFPKVCVYTGVGLMVEF